MAFEREIEMLQQHVEEIHDERSLQILQRAHELKRENEMLKMTLNQLAVYDDGASEGEVDPSEEAYMQMKYYEAMREA
jgi:predicted phosphoribosyltransferase